MPEGCTTVKCGKCGRGEAVLYRPLQRAVVCKSCFFKEIRRNIFHTLARHEMLKHDQRCVVAFSGGKDSQVLLELLNAYQSRRDRSEPVVALTVDEGIGGYRDESLSVARKFCEDLGVEHHVVTFKATFGRTLDQVVEQARERGDRRSACTFCGSFRRYLLNAGAASLGADVLATGHNMDDVVQTFLLNLIKGDLRRLETQAPVTYSVPAGADVAGTAVVAAVPRVKPLREVREVDVTMYCHFRGFQFQEFPCPYSTSDPLLRGLVQRFLNDLDNRTAEAKTNLLRTGDALREALTGQRPPSPPRRPVACSNCGYPSSGASGKCRTCELVEELGLSGPYLSRLPRLSGEDGSQGP
ncbi:MAG: TIGR00269 family protein [Promethearchaeota archaeon]